MALFWRIWAAVTIVNLVVLTVFVVFATLQFGNINAGLVGERLAVLARQTAAPFEAVAKIGLPLATARNAKALLERARQTDDAILAVHVFDAAGHIVHSTAAAPSAMIPAEARTARTTAAGEPWHLETADGFLSSIDIASADGASAGGILIVYPDSASATRIRAMAADLALAALAALVAAAALSALLLRLALARQIRSFDDMDSVIADFERTAWRSAAGRPPQPRADAGELRQLLAAAEERYRAEGRRLTGVGDQPS
jgi:hypothetical protein